MKSFSQYRQGVLRDRILENMAAAQHIRPAEPVQPAAEEAPTQQSGVFFNNMRFAPGLRKKMVQKQNAINPQPQQSPQI